jgi:hypothetical protein
LKLIDQMFAKLLSWMVLCVRSDTANEIESLVLRHQLVVLQRRTPLWGRQRQELGSRSTGRPGLGREILAAQANGSDPG